MRANLAALSITLFLGAATCSAQSSPQGSPVTAPADYTTVNCSNFVTDQKVPDDTRLISGEQSNYKVAFSQGDYVYLNRGQDKGVRVGDRFQVVRPDKDPMDVTWFRWQAKLLKAMGTAYIDAGQIRVVNVLPKVSIARVTFACSGIIERGDVVRPYTERPAPIYRDGNGFDHFAPVSGKPVAMVVTGADWAQTMGTRSLAFVNLGTSQGVKVGDYYRIFRYQGTMVETAPQGDEVQNAMFFAVFSPHPFHWAPAEGTYQYTLYGFGSNPVHYTWKDLPREVLGEGVVLNVSRNSSTIMITHSSVAIYSGDYIEIE
jgi:hypothetical protein